MTSHEQYVIDHRQNTSSNLKVLDSLLIVVPTSTHSHNYWH
uniref:Uncharacterized protein n=1 Tax=Arundo donax TaxID=35708 RepID=A0A0A9SVT4_ARUDO